MVEALEALARARGCSFLYVEVGHEQPLAAQFWSSKHAFRAVQPLERNLEAPSKTPAKTASAPPVEGPKSYSRHSHRSRRRGMKQPPPLLAIIDRISVPIPWHHFFASNCLRFSDTQQFVKSIGSA